MDQKAGEYTFVLRADEGARLVLGGTTIVQMPEGHGESQAYSQTVTLQAGLVPIEVTYYEAVGDAELQLLYVPPGGDLQVVPPDVLFATLPGLTARTDSFGRFTVTNVPANVRIVRVTGPSGGFSAGAAPVPGGITELGDVVLRKLQ